MGRRSDFYFCRCPDSHFRSPHESGSLQAFLSLLSAFTWCGTVVQVCTDNQERSLSAQSLFHRSFIFSCALRCLLSCSHASVQRFLHFAQITTGWHRVRISRLQAPVSGCDPAGVAAVSCLEDVRRTPALGRRTVDTRRNLFLSHRHARVPPHALAHVTCNRLSRINFRAHPDAFLTLLLDV